MFLKDSLLKFFTKIGFGISGVASQKFRGGEVFSKKIFGKNG